jgi:hypothetical protein
VQCLTASQCPYDTPGCSGGICGNCATEADCPPNDICNQGSCTCAGNSGCGGDAPVCIADAGVCGCNTSADCAAGTFCDQSSSLFGVCVAPCTAPAGACDPAGANPYCDTDAGLCAQCLVDAQCADAGLGSYCVGDACVACTADAQCAALDAGTPYCNGECVQCLAPAQ